MQLRISFEDPWRIYMAGWTALSARRFRIQTLACETSRDPACLPAQSWGEACTAKFKPKCKCKPPHNNDCHPVKRYAETVCQF